MENGKYHQLFKFPSINWCQLMAGASKNKVNPLMKTMLANMKKYGKEFIHICPYFGPHSSYNMTLDRSILMIYPTGDYRFTLALFTSSDINMWTMDLVIKSWP